MPVPSMYDPRGDQEAIAQWKALFGSGPAEQQQQPGPFPARGLVEGPQWASRLGHPAVDMYADPSAPATVFPGRNDVTRPGRALKGTNGKFISPVSVPDSVREHLNGGMTRKEVEALAQNEFGQTPASMFGPSRDQLAGGMTKPEVASMAEDPAAPVKVKSRGKAGGGGGGVGTGKNAPMPAGTVGDPTAMVDDDRDLKDLKGFIDKFEKNKKLDLSPMLALADSWGGSNLKAGYNRPMSDEEREQAVLKLRSFAADKEADMRYKKAYLASMQAQDATRMAIHREEMGSRERIAAHHDAARAATSSGMSDAKLRDRLRRNNKGLLMTIAHGYDGDPKNFRNKDYRDMAEVYHQQAEDMAEFAVQNGQAPNFEVGYQAAISELMQDSKQAAEAKRAKAQEDK